MGSDLTLMDAAIQKMRWNEARQKVLAENISNADTPGYAARDVDKPDFSALLKTTTSSLPMGAAQLAETNEKHMNMNGISGEAEKKLEPKRDRITETSPTGNSVVLEDQLLKANENLMDHRMTSTIYQKNIEMIKNALK